MIKYSLFNLILSIWCWLWTFKTPQLKSQYNRRTSLRHSLYTIMSSSSLLVNSMKWKSLKQLPSALVFFFWWGLRIYIFYGVKWIIFYRKIIWRFQKISNIHIFKRNNLSVFSRNQLDISQIFFFKFWRVIYRLNIHLH